MFSMQSVESLSLEGELYRLSYGWTLTRYPELNRALDALYSNHLDKVVAERWPRRGRRPKRLVLVLFSDLRTSFPRILAL